MGEELDSDDHLDIEEIFVKADVNKDNSLSKREIMTVINQSLDKGAFQRFFNHHD
jgi:Ca2+-binding EF-hand superfamily protein